MKKIISIKGMSCGHCAARVENAIRQISGVSAKVDLAKGHALVTLEKDISDEILSAAVAEAGYTVSSITEKKGLFGK